MHVLRDPERIIAVYINDIIISCSSPMKIKWELSQKFEMKDLVVLYHFLGVKIVS